MFRCRYASRKCCFVLHVLYLWDFQHLTAAFYNYTNSVSPYPQFQAVVMEDELLCGVCREMYMAGQREPVVLPFCGHAFCRSCLVKLEEDSGELGSCLSCPTCRTPHKNVSVHALPPVFALLHLSENYRKCLVSIDDVIFSLGTSGN